MDDTPGQAVCLGAAPLHGVMQKHADLCDQRSLGWAAVRGSPGTRGVQTNTPLMRSLVG